MDNISTIILALSLFIIMLGMGLSLTIDDFKRVVIYPKAVIVGLINQLLFVPLIGFLIASFFPMRPEIAVGIMILAACPGGPTSNLISNLAKGDIALSVSLTAISSFITILTIPFIINISMLHFLQEGQYVELKVLNTVIQVFAIVVIPVSIGMLVRRYKTEFANKMESPVRKASAVVILLVIAGLCVKEKENIIPYFKEAGIASLLLNIGTMAVGYYSAKLVKVLDARAISISIESGIQNGTLAISIAVVLLQNTEFAIAPAIYSLLMFLTGGVVVFLARNTSKAKSIK